MPSTIPVVSMQQIKIGFGERIIHNQLDLIVNDKEIVGVIGASGAGKTTLLRALLGLQTIAAGHIQLFGTDIHHASTKIIQQLKQQIGVLFQQSALFSSLTILENIEFPLKKFTKLRGRELAELALTKLSMVGLAVGTAQQYPTQLSGGMLKRAALARALALDPKLLFLDEPTAGLDPKSALQFDRLVLKLRESLGLTIVMISHDLASLARVTDRVAFIGDQHVLAALPYAELIQQQHPLIADYFSELRE